MLSEIKKNLSHDLPASMVVFFVALPLCLGIALASGAPLFAGVIAGIVGGIVVGAASGSPLGVRFLHSLPLLLLLQSVNGLRQKKFVKLGVEAEEADASLFLATSGRSRQEKPVVNCLL